MRRALAAAVAALVVASPAAAGPPQVTARAFYLENGATGEALAGEDARARLPIASITKLMTVLIALERAQLDDVVVAPPIAANVGESTIHLRAGERITVHDLVEAALVQSANDAAWALAAYVGKGDVPAFVHLMNAKAKALGMRDTRFTRPDGLDAPGHVSSARDVTLLARVAMQNATIRSIVDDRVATIAGGRRLHTWNDLLATFPGVIGVKTGHTEAAGWSQVVAVRGYGFVLYATILGSPTRSERNADLAALLRWGLSRYKPVPVVDAKRVYARAEIGFGKWPVAVVAPRAVVRAVRVDRTLRERLVVPTVLALPVRKGQRVGEVRVYDGARLVASSPLVAGRAVEKPGFGARIGWYARHAVDKVLP
ncbi:MAG TPA: D-alanyl-D-alanine carboxypeptidase family protein [Gaiellaceae bacterium]|jgi:D-alanyl-D-alanine carboxypeptidase|nr:D-alanyl-D-alanine carboxypeptidase family protein [Gaiellaceae bacterium]